MMKIFLIGAIRQVPQPERISMKHARMTLLLFLALLFLAPVRGNAAPEKVYKDHELKLISRLTALILRFNHYRPQELNEELSQRLYDKYLNDLDPQHIYFTEEDLKSFEVRKKMLAPDLLQGKMDFVFTVYNLYRTRLAEYIAFAEQETARKQDFTLDESWDLEREKAPRPANKKEQQELWRLRIKGDLLLYRLLDRAMHEDKDVQKNLKQEAAAAAWKWEASTPAKRLLKRLRDISNEVNKKDRIDILGIYLNALAQVFGPHSSYYAPRLSEDFDINMSLSLTGIGATLSSNDGFIRVVQLVPGGPAAKDGRLRVEDRIAVVVQENQETTNLIDLPVSKAVRYIRGPRDSRVLLGVLTDKPGKNPISLNQLIPALKYLSYYTGLPDYSKAFPEWKGKIYLRAYDITRAKVELVDSGAKGVIRTVKTASGEKKIGLLTLPGFYHDFAALRRGDKNAKRCSTDVAKILQRFNKENVHAVVLDLRRNGGGSLPEAIATTGLFIPTGPVVQIRDAEGNISVEKDENKLLLYKGPLVILTSKLSASASEILAAALRDCSRALLVGDSRTFGKGTILRVEDLEQHIRWKGKKLNSGSTTFETAMFFRTNGGSVQQLGITPDIVLPSMTEELKVGEMFLDHHLPWDEIRAVPRMQFDGDLTGKARVLQAASRKRIAADPEYRKLLHRIEVYRAHKDRKHLSLNEEKRWKEYRRDRDMEETAEHLMELENAPESKTDTHDPVLQETLNIAADYAELD